MYGFYLWVVDPRQVTFSCSPKRKSPKRRAPRMAQTASCAPRIWGPRRATVRSLYCRSVADVLVRDPDGLHPKPSGARSAPYGSRDNSYQRETRLPVAAIDRRTPYVRFKVVALVSGPHRASRAPEGKPRGVARRCRVRARAVICCAPASSARARLS